MNMDNEEFWRWLRNHGVAVWGSVVAVLALLANAPERAATITRLFGAYAAAMPAVLHVVVLFVFMLLLGLLKYPEVHASRRESLDRALAALHQFRVAWSVVVLTWFLLYVIMTLQSLPLLPPALRNGAKAQLIWSLLEIAFNNVQTLSLGLCFLVLSESSLESLGDTGTRRYRSTMAIPAFIGVMAVVILTAVQCLISSATQNTFHAALISGLLASVAFGLFIGRLESKYIEVSRGVMAALYLYAAVQVLFAFFAANAGLDAFAAPIRPVVVVAALLLKTLMFAFIYWCYATGRLLYYFDRVHHLQDSVSTDWTQFSSTLATPAPAPTPLNVVPRAVNQ
jgi:hypothetical protein